MTDIVEAPPRSARVAGLAAAVLLVAAGAVFMVVHAVAGDASGPEGWPQHVSMGLPLLATGVIAWIGSVARCPWLMVVAGATALPICLVSVVGLPALLPAGVVLAVGVSGLTTVSAREWLAAVGIAGPLVLAFGYEVLHQDPAEWSTPDGGAGSSNVVTMTESFVVYVAVAIALVVALAYVRAHRRRQ